MQSLNFLTFIYIGVFPGSPKSGIERLVLILVSKKMVNAGATGRLRGVGCFRHSERTVSGVSLFFLRSPQAWMGGGKPSRYEASQLGRLSLLPSVGW